MKPSEIKKIRGKLHQQPFCDELNKISKTLLPDAAIITVRALRNWETDTDSHREPPEWIRYVIMQYENLK